MPNVGAAIVGLVIFVAGGAAAFFGFRDVARWRRFGRTGVTVPARVVDKSSAPGDSHSGGPTYSITARWTWGGNDYENTYEVSRRVYQLKGETPIEVRFDAATPQVAVLADRSSTLRDLGWAVAGVLIAIGGLVGMLLGLGVL